MRKLAVILLLITCISCERENGSHCLQGYGEPSEIKIPLPYFNNIEFHDVFDVYLVHDTIDELTINTGSNLLDDIEIETEGSKIHVYNLARCRWLRDYARVALTVRFRNLNRVGIRSPCYLESLNTIRRPAFDIYSFAKVFEGNIKVDNDKLKFGVNFSCAGSCRLSGRTGELEIMNRGVHHVFADSLVSLKADITNNSSGDIHAGLMDTLEAHIWLNGDIYYRGDPEIVVHSLDGLIWAWHHDGSELADGDSDPGTNGVFLTFPGASWGKSSPALFDLDGDDAKDIIFGTCYSEGDNQLVAYRHDRTLVAGFPYVTGPGKILSSPTVADLNRDGTWEIIIISKYHQLHVVQQDGSSYPGFPITFMAATEHTPSAAVGNFDTDDHLEIVAIATLNSQEADLYIIDTSGGTSGQPLPGWPQQLHGVSEASPVVGDIDGDGTPDIVHGIGGLHEESPNNLYAFKGNGEPVDGFPITLGAPLRNSPIICDLDYDGDVDIVYGSWDLLMHVWDLPFTYDRLNTPWPTFRGHFYRDGVYRTEDLVDVNGELPDANLLVTLPYPNPFNPSTSIRLYVPGAAGSQEPLEVSIYDLRGRRVTTLHDGPINVGWHTLIWDGRDTEGRGQASGVYFLRARNTRQSVIQKMSLVK